MVSLFACMIRFLIVYVRGFLLLRGAVAAIECGWTALDKTQLLIAFLLLEWRVPRL
jgi:hypothetical protein